VNAPGRRDCLRTRVSVQAALETFYCANQLFPVLKLVWTGLNIGLELSDFGQLLVAHAITVVGHCWAGFLVRRFELDEMLRLVLCYADGASGVRGEGAIAMSESRW
jgi:hypothetical protein